MVKVAKFIHMVKLFPVFAYTFYLKYIRNIYTDLVTTTIKPEFKIVVFTLVCTSMNKVDFTYL